MKITRKNHGTFLSANKGNVHINVDCYGFYKSDYVKGHVTLYVTDEQTKTTQYSDKLAITGPFDYAEVDIILRHDEAEQFDNGERKFTTVESFMGEILSQGDPKIGLLSHKNRIRFGMNFSKI